MDPRQNSDEANRNGIVFRKITSKNQMKLKFLQMKRKKKNSQNNSQESSLNKRFSENKQFPHPKQTKKRENRENIGLKSGNKSQRSSYLFGQSPHLSQKTPKQFRNSSKQKYSKQFEKSAPHREEYINSFENNSNSRVRQNNTLQNQNHNKIKKHSGNTDFLAARKTSNHLSEFSNSQNFDLSKDKKSANRHLHPVFQQKSNQILENRRNHAKLHSNNRSFNQTLNYQSQSDAGYLHQKSSSYSQKNRHFKSICDSEGDKYSNFNSLQNTHEYSESLGFNPTNKHVHLKKRKHNFQNRYLSSQKHRKQKLVKENEKTRVPFMLQDYGSFLHLISPFNIYDLNITIKDFGFRDNYSSNGLNSKFYNTLKPHKFHLES